MLKLKGAWTIALVFAATVCAAKPGPAGIPLFQSTATRSGDMKLSQIALDQLRGSTDTVSLSGIPLVNGTSGDFTLTPMPIFSPDAQITLMKDNGATESVALPDTRSWYGTDPSDPSIALFASADATGTVRVMITGDSNTSVTIIAPRRPGDSASYAIETTALPDKPFCGNDSLAISSSRRGQATIPSSTRGTRNNTLYELQMMIDVGHKLYLKENSDPYLTLDHLIDLFGAANAIYQRDLKLRLSVVSLTIWETTDPITVDNDHSDGVSTGEQLENYQTYIANNRAGVSRDLAHFLDYDPDLGGIGFVDVLGAGQEFYRCAISNVFADGDFPADYNTYYWDTLIFCHETGHNVGSEHTQCYSPPIDCCYIKDECSQCTTAAPAAGTIMSYCHLQFDNGGSVIMKFHQRCIDLMRPKIEASPIVSPFANQPDIVVSGVDGIYCPNGGVQVGLGSILRSTSVGAAPIDVSFAIENHGTTNLSLTGNPKVTVSGDPLISIAGQPATSSIMPNGTPASFTIRFNPATAGRHTAIVYIASNDPDTPVYSFPVIGTFVQPAPAQTFTFNGNTAIPDGGEYYTMIPITVSGVSGGVISDINVSINGTNCNKAAQTGIQHPFVGDLAIALLSPTGTQVQLMNSPGEGFEGSEGKNFCHTILDDSATIPIENIVKADAPYSNSYSPDELLSAFNGQNPSGTWQFLVYDYPDGGGSAGGSGGKVHSVSLIISGQIESDVPDWSVYK